MIFKRQGEKDVKNELIEKVKSFKKHHNNGLLVRLSPSRMFITYDPILSTAYCSPKNGDEEAVIFNFRSQHTKFKDRLKFGY